MFGWFSDASRRASRSKRSRRSVSASQGSGRIQCDIASERRIVGAVDLAHAADAE
jgi:hypothetical protein